LDRDNNLKTRFHTCGVLSRDVLLTLPSTVLHAHAGLGMLTSRLTLSPTVSVNAPCSFYYFWLAVQLSNSPNEPEKRAGINLGEVFSSEKPRNLLSILSRE